MTHEEIEQWFHRDETSCDVFICRCGDENNKEADEFLVEVKRQLSASRNIPGVFPDNLFLTLVVIDLEWHHSAHISGIYADQWSRVDAEVYDDGEREPYTVSAQCDNVEDGIAAVWWAYQHRVAVPDASGESGSAPADVAGELLR